MNNKPLISIALCTYNGEAYLKEQLESLVSQTYQPIEIRIRDDQYTDGTAEIIREFQSQYPYIGLEVNPIKLGLQRNFEQVFQDCTGDLIAPCDQDDIWHPEKVQLLAEALKGHQIVYNDSILIDADGKDMGIKMSDKFRLKNWNRQEPFLLFNCISGHSMLFQKSLLKAAIPFPDTGYYDHWITYVALAKGTIGFVPRALVNYRQHAANQTDLLGKKQVLSGIERAKNRIKRENSWLMSCERYNQQHVGNPFIHPFADWALARENSFFSFTLGWQIFKHQELLLAILPGSFFKKVGFALRYSFGLKLKAVYYSFL